MRPSLVVTATIAMDLFPIVTAPQVTVSEINLGPRASATGEGLLPSAGPPRFRIGGYVTDATHVGVVDASVSIVEIGLVAKTDLQGRYQLGSMTAGTYTIRVEKGATVKNVTVTVPPGVGTTYDVQL